MPYPDGTQSLHHEVELVVAIGLQGADIDTSEAADFIYGYAVGLDLTRRDLQAALKEKGRRGRSPRASRPPVRSARSPQGKDR